MSLLEHPTAQALLADAEISAASVRGCSQRLQRFLQRYLPRFYRQEQRVLALQRSEASKLSWSLQPGPSGTRVAVLVVLEEIL
jgi:hypothetical protein